MVWDELRAGLSDIASGVKEVAEATGEKLQRGYDANASKIGQFLEERRETKELQNALAGAGERYEVPSAVQSYSSGGRPIALYRASSPASVSISTTNPSASNYEHGILKSIPVVNKLPHLNETQEEAQRRRQAKRIEELEDLKIKQLKGAIENSNRIARAKAMQEEARAARLRG